MYMPGYPRIIEIRSKRGSRRTQTRPVYFHSQFFFNTKQRIQVFATIYIINQRSPRGVKQCWPFLFFLSLFLCYEHEEWESWFVD